MTVVLDVPPNMEATLRSHANAQGLTVSGYLLALVERDTLAPPPGSENWTLQDALDHAGPLPDDLGVACAYASQETLKRIWDNSEDAAAWPAS
jgi:hypothetical protein